ncbi:MAG TPA: cupin domain-containing protein [Actinomycetota bacterium]|nr:cupin domain-containing protein [Actinomycetota bacterium]
MIDLIAESLDEQELAEMYATDDPSVRPRSSWPAWKDEGSDAAACYFEIPPGCSLGPHVHDAEESVVILAGRATATIGGERKALEGPALVVMPEGVTHDLTNEGDDTLRAVGYFPRNSVTTTFEQEMQPNGSRTAGTPDSAA